MEKENLKTNGEDLKRTTSMALKASERIADAIEKNTTDTLNYDAEKILSKDLSVTVNSIKAELLAYRIFKNRLS